MSRYTLLGIDDEVTTCDCCGKRNLKCTVALESADGIVRFGRDCAARALGKRSTTADKMEREARTVSAANLGGSWRIWPTEPRNMGWTSVPFHFESAGGIAVGSTSFPAAHMVWALNGGTSEGPWRWVGDFDGGSRRAFRKAA